LISEAKKVVSVLDEAFTILALMNYWERWTGNGTARSFDNHWLEDNRVIWYGSERWDYCLHVLLRRLCGERQRCCCSGSLANSRG
jgi:hypothetical protein